MSDKINNIFSSIADVYDFWGHLFSFGIDGIWRKMAAEEAISDIDGYKILDVATGTGSIAIDIAKKAKRAKKRVEIVGVDFNSDMIKIAEDKIKKKKIKNICFKIEDAMDLGEPGCAYDVVTAGFLLRNVDDTEVFAEELRRILKKNGKFILLEMGRPQNKLLNIFFKSYFFIIRLVGSLIDEKAYDWLTYSILAFDIKKMMDILKDKGFKDLKIKNLPLHVGFLITGIKS
ncbi:MAG: ubiquinone/menaquinone biosynthesis methyltransferase [Deltaproteobacteria bacterium]|nr:ubiquinone/menaquinone biosynthesis methyltransferase [Deltaproteobacteria bacterium]